MLEKKYAAAASGSGTASAARLLSALLPSQPGILVQPAPRPLLLQHINQHLFNFYTQTNYLTLIPTSQLCSECA